MQIIILALLFSAANAVDCSTTGGSASCAAAENMAVSVMNHFNVFDSVDRLLFGYIKLYDLTLYFVLLFFV